MPRRTAEPLVRICVRLYESDVAFLNAISTADFGFNEQLRTILRKYVTVARAQDREKIDALPRLSPSTSAALEDIINDIKQQG